MNTSTPIESEVVVEALTLGGVGIPWQTLPTHDVACGKSHPITAGVWNPVPVQAVGFHGQESSFIVPGEETGVIGNCEVEENQERVHGVVTPEDT